MIFKSLLINPSYIRGYINWLFAILYSYWIFIPENKAKVANAVAVFLCKEHSEYNNISSIGLYEEILLVRLQNIIPLDFFGLVLNNPLCESKWGDRYEKVQIEMTQVLGGLYHNYTKKVA